MNLPAVRHLYVHVPFCRAKCDYCDFYSEPVGDGARPRFEEYIEALHAEWAATAARYDVQRLHTLYLGGGSPSLLGPELLDLLLAPFAPLLSTRTELTVETNPEDVDDTFARWATAGVSGGAAADRAAADARCPVRISLGVQSFVPALRAALGRATDADPEAAFARLRMAGCDNVSVDLIYGIPGQTLADIARELIKIAMLAPDHVSWYELDLDHDVPLACVVDTADRLDEDEDEERAAMYVRIVHGLEDFGFRWYEVSNFAQPGKRARHNVAYWRGHSYVGLGPGAVSTVGGTRWRNAPDVAAYVRAVRERSEPEREYERLSREERARERLFLAARMGAPVSLNAIAPALDQTALQPLADAGLLSLGSGTLTVTRKGRYVANAVCVRLFRDSCL
jgi:oxygen-independent coproporphyrinogen-3 oxidase